MDVDAGKVEYNIRAEPHGHMAGMYNILAFRKMHQSEPICKEPTPVQRPATATITQQNLPQIVDTNRPGTACECNQQMTASQKRKDMLSSNTNITTKAAKQPVNFRIISTNYYLNNAFLFYRVHYQTQYGFTVLELSRRLIICVATLHQWKKR